MASALGAYWEYADWDQDLQEKLRARYKAGKKLSFAEHKWAAYDFNDREWVKPTTRMAWLKVVEEHNGYGAGIRMKKRRSTHKKKKKKPSKKYRSRRRKHTKRR